ncbi:MAG: hypoxanthine phosphoribosyltransferase [Lachnospiraceae bacterium]|nr:hypoxanthine phosphoribosyltransferase [Lachnospiraceae bacterium]
MSDKITELLSEKKVDDRIRQLGAQITRDYEGEEVLFVCTLKGASFFACELAKRVKVPLKMDFIVAASYGNEMQSSGEVRMVKDLEESIEGKNVIIVEDIIDTGRTLSYLMDLFKKRNPKTLKLCSLLDKPERRVVEIRADYTGFEIPDLFVVGYGLDYAQKYRNLPYIGVVEPEE